MPEKLTLKPTPPYDIKSHFETYLGHKPQPQTYLEESYRRAIHISEKPVPFEVGLNENVEDPVLKVRVYSKLSEAGLKRAREIIEWIFNTQLDLKPMYKFMETKPSLKPLMKRNYGLRPERCPTFHEALIKTVIEQQISLQVAKEMTWQLISKFGRRLSEGNRNFWTFPTPDKLAEEEVEEIKDCKLSRRKAEYIKNISQLVVSGELEELKNKKAEEIIEKLMEIRGIGKWTAEMATIRFFGTESVNPAGDLGIRREISKFLGKDERLAEQEIRDYASEWGDYKGLIAYYILSDS